MTPNPSLLRRRRLAGVALAVLALPLAAQVPVPPQDPVRIPVATPAAEPADAAPPLGPIVEQRRDATEVAASPLVHVPPADDEPDFVPWPTALGVEGEADPMPVDTDPYVLAFRGAEWRPAPGLDPRLDTAARRDPDGASYAYAMIEGRMSAPDKIAALTARGCRILGVHTWQSYVVHVPHAAAGAVANLPFVRWIGYPRLEQKIDPDLAHAVATAPDAGDDAAAPLEIVVSVQASDLGPASVVETLDVAPQGDGTEQEALGVRTATIPNGPFHEALVAAGFTFASYHEIDNVFVFRGTVAPAVVERLAALDFVAYVEPHRTPELADDQSMTMIAIDRVRADYGGSGVSVGVVDSGVQGGAGRHFDLNKFFVGWSNVPGEGAFIDGDGHGTHVAGTIGGDGSIDRRYRGAAPDMGDSAASRVFVGRIFDSTGAYRGPFETIYAALANDFTSGGVTSRRPPVINNSWGTQAPTTQYRGTEAAPRIVDGYVWDRDQLHVFAAGNAGVGVLLEASAKNALTVGSVSDFAGGGGPAGTMSSFSRFGTADNRRKPEVVAPGNLITSTSHLSQNGYRNLLGTSMAAPHVTGALTGLVDHYAFLGYRPDRLKAIAAATAEGQGNPGAGTGWFGSNGGYGLINAHRMHFSTPNHELFWGGTSTFTRTGDSLFWEVSIPAGVAAVRTVVSWVEPAAAAGAAAAKVNDVRCWLDVEPFSTAPNAGDFALTVTPDNSLSIASAGGSGFAAAAAGRRVRIKVYGQAILTQARAGFAMVAYREDPYSTAPTLTVTPSATATRPGSVIEIEARVREGIGGDEFVNLRLAPSFAPFSIVRMERTTVDGFLHAYTDGSHPSNPLPSFAEGMVVGSGIVRDLTWQVRAPSTSGVYPLTVNATAFPTPAPATRSVDICVDGLAPAQIAGLTASIPASAWSNVSFIDFSWNAAADVGCAGLTGLGIAFGQGVQPDPETTTVSSLTTFSRRSVTDTATTADGYRWKLRAIDRATNRGPIAQLGPFLIDQTDPVGQSIVIAGGAGTTTTLNVAVALRATDVPSGVVDMRFSANGTTWSAWQAYATSVSIDLSANGGTSGEGVKRLFVEFRDRAGNTSAAISDTIEYLRLPTITGVVVGSTATVGNTPLVLDGTGFSGTTRVAFGPLTITGFEASQHARGWFDVVSDTRIRVFVPQGLAPGAYPLQVGNLAGLSDPVTTSLTAPTTRTLATATSVRVGQPQFWFSHHGGAVGGTTSLLVLSPFAAPSVLPGTIQLGIGANFAALFVLEPAVAHDGTTGAATIGPLPIPASFAGATWHAQAIQIDAVNPGRLPFAVTNVVSTSYR